MTLLFTAVGNPNTRTENPRNLSNLPDPEYLASSYRSTINGIIGGRRLQIH